MAMITVVNRQSRYKINTKKFKLLLQKLARRYRLKDPEVCLSFVGLDRIKKLNKRYLKKNAPTDVLSFPLAERAADGKYYLGDILIAPEIARRQCREKGLNLERELEILTVHGFLHLLGYDHSAGIEKEEAGLRTGLLKETRRGGRPGRKPRLRQRPASSRHASARVN